MFSFFKRDPKKYIEKTRRWVIIDDKPVLHDHYRIDNDVFGYSYIPYKDGYEFQKVQSNNRWGLDAYLSILDQPEENP